MATATQQRYNVGGILLPQPFKVRRLGHFGFNAVQLTECLEFYNAVLGFKISDMLDFAAVPGMPEHVKTLGDTRGY
jgi:predicted enzyme related to lactoylglutathione lyase